MKKSILHKKFNRFITNNGVFKKNSSVLAAISGGQDSICLLKLLKDYQIHKEISIHVIHFDHGWRTDSSRNMDFVRTIAHRWCCEFHNYKTDAILSEEKARHWRYAKMKEVCLTLNIGYIATGHTNSDRLETIFFNMMKGSGFEGIQAIQPLISIHRQIDLIHPLLSIKREETLWFCRKFLLPIWSDSTNYNIQITRNRIREEILPYCKQYFNTNIEDALYKFTENINYDLDYLQERTYYLYYKYKHPKYIGINKIALLLIPIAIRKRILRVFVYHNTNIRLNFLETQEYLSLINSHKIEVKQLSSNWYLCSSNTWIYLLSNNIIQKI